MPGQLWLQRCSCLLAFILTTPWEISAAAAPTCCEDGLKRDPAGVRSRCTLEIPFYSRPCSVERWDSGRLANPAESILPAFLGQFFVLCRQQGKRKKYVLIFLPTFPDPRTKGASLPPRAVTLLVNIFMTPNSSCRSGCHSLAGKPYGTPRNK